MNVQIRICLLELKLSGCSFIESGESKYCDIWRGKIRIGAGDWQLADGTFEKLR